MHVFRDFQVWLGLVEFENGAILFSIKYHFCLLLGLVEFENGAIFCLVRGLSVP